MMRRMLALVLVAASAATVSRVRLERPAEAGAPARELLYLPNGRYLRVASLGHATLLADVVYLWAIQFYSDYDRQDRYRFVEHIFGTVIPELDPRYVDPYWLGALILIAEVGDVDRGLRLLDLGMERNPDAWILPYLAGWEAERAGRLAPAAQYFDRVASIPGAPAFVRRMKAGILARAGRIDEAVRLWEEVRSDPQSDAAARAIAESWLRILRVQQDLRRLTAAIAAFRERFGCNPGRLAELVGAGLLRSVPIDPDGRPYDYHPATGQVSSPAGRILGARE